MIRTENLTKVYNGKKAVDGLDLEVGEGEIFGFLGPNGAGKSTTILMLTGMIEPTGGRCLVDGIEVAKDPLQVKKIIGYLPEDVGFYGNMTGEQNLDYFARFYGMDARERKDRIAELLELVHLDGVTQKAGEYSRGMKQRLGIAKALVNRPQIIFLDEPTLGLDPRGQREIQQLLFDINKSDGITIFITSHMLKDIEVLCNKVCIIKDGSLVEQGSIRELQEKYRDGYSMLLQTSDNEAAEGLIRKLKKVARVAGEDGQLLIECESGLSDDEVLSVKHELVTAILSNGLDIREMTHKTLSMEDIFFKVTDAEKEGIA